MNYHVFRFQTKKVTLGSEICFWNLLIKVWEFFVSPLLFVSWCTLLFFRWSKNFSCWILDEDLMKLTNLTINDNLCLSYFVGCCFPIYCASWQSFNKLLPCPKDNWSYTKYLYNCICCQQSFNKIQQEIHLLQLKNSRVDQETKSKKSQWIQNTFDTQILLINCQWPEYQIGLHLISLRIPLRNTFTVFFSDIFWGNVTGAKED